MKTKIEVYFRITHTRKASNIGHELEFCHLLYSEQKRQIG